MGMEYNQKKTHEAYHQQNGMIVKAFDQAQMQIQSEAAKLQLPIPAQQQVVAQPAAPVVQAAAPVTYAAPPTTYAAPQTYAAPVTYAAPGASYAAAPAYAV